MNAVDPHTLTGAYALDALDPEERAAVRLHLAGCPSCAREVEEFSETVARLGLAVAVPPPASLRAGVMERIATVRQEPPPTPRAARTSETARNPETARTSEAARNPEAAPAPEAGPTSEAERASETPSPPESARASAAERASETPSPPAAVRASEAARTPRGRRGARWSRWALAACLAGAVGLGGIAAWQGRQAGEAREETEQARAANDAVAVVLAAPDAQVSTSRLGGGAVGTVVVSASLDQAVFAASGMAPPPAGKVYQLWYDDDGTMRPAGLMDPGATAEATLLEGPVDGAAGMGITVEPAGGSPQPTSAPVAVLAFPEA
ncbi:anti-sigma factor [Streptomyces sp. NPDC055103]